MSHRNNAPLSFNTRKQSHRKDRLHRMQQGRMTLLALCAVVLLLAVTGLIFLICHIAVSVQNRPDQDENTPPDAQIKYELVSRSYSEIYLGDLIVVNNSHIYTFPTVSMENVTNYRERVDGTLPYLIPNIKDPPQMQSEAAQQLSAMLTQYYQLSGDNSLVVYDAYRTQEEQADGNYSVAAGYSEHHTGLLVALSVETTSSEPLDPDNTHEWIYDNCQNYGFIQRYPSGKTGITGVGNYTEAFRYVGIPHATYMSANGLCLEEYVELLRNNHTSANGTDGAHLRIDVNGDGNTDYEVYYVPGNNQPNALTTVPVPQNFGYTISGDNIGGFIVTVDLNAPKNAA